MTELLWFPIVLVGIALVFCVLWIIQSMEHQRKQKEIQRRKGSIYDQ